MSDMSDTQQGPEVEHRRTWRFAQTSDGAWVWIIRNPDGSEETSQPFKTLLECTAAAQQNGYVMWKPEDERRRDQQLSVAKALRGSQE